MNTLGVLQLIMDGVSNKILLSEIMVELFKSGVLPKARVISILDLLEKESRNDKDVTFAIAAGFVCDKDLTTAFAIELSHGTHAPLTHRSGHNSHFGAGYFLGALKGCALLRDQSFGLLMSGKECERTEDILLIALESFLFGTQGEMRFSGGTEGLLSEIVTELVDKNPAFTRVFLTRVLKNKATKVWSPLAVQVVDEFTYKAFSKLLSVSERAAAVSEYLAKKAAA